MGNEIISVCTEFKDTLEGIKDFLGEISTTLTNIVSDPISNVAENFTILSGALGFAQSMMTIFGVTANTALGYLIGFTVLVEIAQLIIDNLGAIGEFFTNLWNGLKDQINSIWEWINTDIIKPIVNLFVSLWETLKTSVEAVKDFFVNLFNTVVEWINTNVIQPVTTFFIGLWETVVNAFQEAIDFVVNIFTTVAEWINLNVVQPISNFFTNLWNTITTSFQNAIDFIVNLFTTIVQWINTNVVQPIVAFFTNLWNTISGAFQNAINFIVDLFNTVVRWVNSNVASSLLVISLLTFGMVLQAHFKQALILSLIFLTVLLPFSKTK